LEARRGAEIKTLASMKPVRYVAAYNAVQSMAPFDKAVLILKAERCLWIHLIEFHGLYPSNLQVQVKDGRQTGGQPAFIKSYAIMSLTAKLSTALLSPKTSVGATLDRSKSN
jgi:hypothetical protein